MRTWNQHLARAASALALLLIAGGCGGGDGLSHDEYEQQLTSVLTTTNASMFKLGLAISRAPAPRLVRPRARLLEQLLSEAADELEQMRPPDDVERPHRELATAMRALANEVDKAAKPDPTRRQRPTAGFLDALLGSKPSQTITRATRTISKEGYDLGGAR